MPDCKVGWKTYPRQSLWRGWVPSEDPREIDTTPSAITLPTGGLNAMQMEQVNRSV